MTAPPTAARCPKLAAALGAGPLTAESLRQLLDSQSMVKLFEAPDHGVASCRGGPVMVPTYIVNVNQWFILMVDVNG